MGPSTLPSICRSSSLEISPFTTMVAPRHASVRAEGAPGRFTAGRFTGPTGIFESFDGDIPGTSDCESLFHIVPPTFHSKIDLAPKDHSIAHCRWIGQRRLPQNGRVLLTSKPARGDRLSRKNLMLPNQAIAAFAETKTCWP